MSITRRHLLTNAGFSLPATRIEWFVNAMFLEDVGRDERQMNGLSEFRGHASRSNGHEANSGDGGRNLQRAIGRPGFLSCRWPDKMRLSVAKACGSSSAASISSESVIPSKPSGSGQCSIQSRGRMCSTDG